MQNTINSFLDFLEEKYLQEYIKQGGSKIKFVTGKKGSGKSSFLNQIQERAKNNNYKVNILFLIVLAPIISYLYIKSIKDYKYKLSIMHDVILIDGDNIIKLKGYLDTGNTLVDPIFKYPVIMINDKIKFLNNNLKFKYQKIKYMYFYSRKLYINFIWF